MRTSGILMPIFSLSSPYGVGTFGKEAYEFVDFLVKAGQRFWQVLPLGPTGYGDSPYQSFSSFAGNPYFIDLRLLLQEGLLTDEEIQTVDFGDDPSSVDYGKLYQNRLPLLRKAYARFTPSKEYHTFCAENAWWLDEYVLFMAIKDAHDGAEWSTWEQPLRLREETALADARKTYADELFFYRFVQYVFYTQWTALKRYAATVGVRIIGDIPIYVAYDSADVWADPIQFQLDEQLKPTLVAGVPPDAFCEEGQLWGNPLYNWMYMKQDGYRWWKRRLQYALQTYDIVRIDHFRGFESYFAVPFEEKTAKNGYWVKGPGVELFEELSETLGQELPIIAEDLGFLTPAVHELLEKSGFPGMKVLQFAFDSREDSDYLPHHYVRNCVVYTGTHDNDTIMGWTASAEPADVERARRYLHVDDQEGFNWAMIRAALMSVADLAILMMQDIIGLGSEARINTPSTVGNNWKWRIQDHYLNDWLAGIVRENTALYGRISETKNHP